MSEEEPLDSDADPDSSLSSSSGGAGKKNDQGPDRSSRRSPDAWQHDYAPCLVDFLLTGAGSPHDARRLMNGTWRGLDQDVLLRWHAGPAPLVAMEPDLDRRLRAFLDVWVVQNAAAADSSSPTGPETRPEIRPETRPETGPKSKTDLGK